LSWNSAFSEVDSSGTYCPVQRSEEHFPEGLGQYSIRISNDTALWNSGAEPTSWLGWGIVFSSKLNDRPLFPVQGRPKSFCGYYRFQPENGDTLNLRAFLYSNGQEIAMAHFRSDEISNGWLPFRAYFNDTNYLSVDSARITLSSANEPKDGSKGPLGNSVLWVDNLSFDSLLTAIPSRIAASSGTPVFGWDAGGKLVLRRKENLTNENARIGLFDLSGRLLLFSDWPAGSVELVPEVKNHPSLMILRYTDRNHDGFFRIPMKFME
jgi:hypothetical protein